MIGGRVLDTIAIYGFIRRSPYIEAVVWSSVEDHIVLVVPIPALAAALAQIPEHDRDIVDVLLRDVPVTITTGDLTAQTAAGLADTLRPAGGAAPAALTAASVVHAAKTRGWPVLTSEPYPLRALWPDIAIEPMP
ncbi:hypothetical protein ACOZ38_28470 [Sphaerisporangium viridialbum]|uniref:hypothetical protein n=1 Tax=Sphaerisporangium viridialbum TaxID=46189 RepID=UPI003C7774BC